MKRGKPLVSKGFKPKVYERAPSAPSLVAAAIRGLHAKPPAMVKTQSTSEQSLGGVYYAFMSNWRGSNTVFNPQPKFPYIRSTTIQVACRTIPCQHCLIRTHTEAWAHSNWAVHGKGASVKASDQYVAALCTECHAMLDQGSKLSERQRQMMWFLAHRATVVLLLQLGRWPAEVPVPNIIDYPF